MSELKYIELGEAKGVIKANGWQNPDLPDIVNLILDMVPAADVVKVCRCKDCVWWELRECGSTVGRCENPRNGLCNEYTDDTDFCSYGERKETAP